MVVRRQGEAILEVAHPVGAHLAMVAMALRAAATAGGASVALELAAEVATAAGVAVACQWGTVNAMGVPSQPSL